MSKHTPGPWRQSYCCGGQNVIGPDGIMVADCAIFYCGPEANDKRSDDENVANARLIAAAPALLAALEICLGHLTGGMDGKWPPDYDLIGTIRAAVEKAKEG